MTKEELEYNRGYRYGYERGELNGYKLRKSEEKHCEDAVSRQSVNELFDSEIKMYEERIETRKGSNYHDETERIKEFRSRVANAEYWQDKIRALPPVTPTHKRGKWINKSHTSDCGIKFVASECTCCGKKTFF